MAEKKSTERTESAEKAVENRSTAQKAVTAEPVYTLAELAANAARFDVRREIVVAALRYYGKTAATEKEAAAMIEKFRKKEVR